ncbi:VWA domain-containing protein, partial [Pirellulales bacterium]|nr:VWA domain-containing protein [Pirellulales bacterium]
TDIELDAETLEEFSEELPTDLVDPGEAALGELSTDAALSEISAESGESGSALGELGSLFGDAGSGLGDLGDGMGQPPASATFFGAKIEGNRVLFLVDNSGGMQSGGLEALNAELLKSVAAMTPKQHFYVIFYSDTVYPLFYPDPATSLVRPTERNRESLQAWLDTVEVCLGNAIDEGLAVATQIEPDVVYFLTDGRVNTTRDGRKLQMFLDSAGRRFTIHTFGMGTGDEGEAATQLQQIAAANGGTFKSVEITAAHRALAREKNRPYHNRGPGPIWGRAVKPPR